MALNVTNSASGVDQASKLIEQALELDSNYNDLSELLQLTNFNQPVVSGLLDGDYPLLTDKRLPFKSLSDLDEIRRVPLPQELVEQFNLMQCNCMMGIFPEMSRAWLTIDSNIFVWNYEDGSDLAYFDGQSEIILSVALVKPKPNIFHEDICFLLCLATPIDIVLLGVSFAGTLDGGEPEMHLRPDPLFALPTDNVHIKHIVGADNGRIFMGGQDGCLYELHYQATDGWFTRKCRKINHSTSSLSYILPSFLNFSLSDEGPLVQIDIDNERSILYTRSEKGAIQVFDMGSDGKGMSRCAVISSSSLLYNACQIAKTIDKSNFKTIVHIAAISASESVNIHLVAITDTGARLYFTANSFSDSTSRPSTIHLVHIRLPPGFTATHVQKPSNIHKAHHRNGLLLMAGSHNDENNLLYTNCCDIFPFQKILKETQGLYPIDGHIWAISEVPTSYDSSVKDGPVIKANPPLVVTQHMTVPRKFVLLNTQGSFIIRKLSPVDQLKKLLLSYGGPDSDEVKAFFQLLNNDQACASCLILACSNLNLTDPHISSWATSAYFLYGNEMAGNTLFPGSLNSTIASPGYTSFNPFSPGASFHPNMISTPNVNQNMSLLSSNTGVPANTEVKFSGRHNGLCLYLSRILRLIWKQKIVSDVPSTELSGAHKFLISRFNGQELSWYYEQLKSIKNFLERNSRFAQTNLSDDSFVANSHPFPSIGIGHKKDVVRHKLSSEAHIHETTSLQNLQLLVCTILEFLGLWKLLCDHSFHVVAGKLSNELQLSLKQMTFQDFVLNGKQLASELIQHLISLYLDDNAATDAISDNMRNICPSLYTCDDATLAKANEYIMLAKNCDNVDKDKLLRDALCLYRKITPHINISAVCTQLASVNYYKGIVDLSLTVAEKNDAQGLGLHYYKNGKRNEDTAGHNSYNMRKDCYRCITEMLDFLLNATLTSPTTCGMPKSPGPPPAIESAGLSSAEAEKYTEQCFDLCLQSSDELFHVTLYEWLICNNLTEKLLEINTPYLESFLKDSIASNSDLLMLDLLWRYYERAHNFSAAAKILSKLADRHSTDVSLQQRIEYLSRATMSAKSATTFGTSASEGEFLHELEEKMEVVRLQLQIYDTLSKYDRDNPEVKDAISRLNSDLLDISTLYGDFADVFDLSECKLAILHCAGHYDASLVESLWKSMIDKEIMTVGTLNLDLIQNSINSKLITLGTQYLSSDRYFPVAFLVKYLEKNGCELDLNPKFVFSAFLEIGVTASKLLEIYDQLYKSKDTIWQILKKPYHLLGVICHLLHNVVNNPLQIPVYERRPFITTCLDTVNYYIVDLQGACSSDSTLNTLLTDLKTLQIKFENM